MDSPSIVDRIRENLATCSERERYYFLKILEELAESEDGRSQTYEDIWLADYKEIPVSIDTFLNTDAYLGKTNNNGQSVYPFWRKELNTVFDAGNKYYEWILTGATRIGKSSTAVTAVAYMLYRLMCLRNPQKFFGKKEISKFSILFFNLTLDLAKGVAFHEFNSTLKESPWFLSNGHFTNSEENYIYIPDGGKIDIDYGSSYSVGLGKQVFCLIGKQKVVTDHGIMTLEEMSRSDSTLLVSSYNQDSGHTEFKPSECTILTKYVTDTISIELEDGTVIEGTADHMVLMSDGRYKMLGEITENDDIMEVEEWRDIPGYEGMYQVSSFGNVRSCDRYSYTYKNGVRKAHHTGARMIKLSRNSTYGSVRLSKNGVQQTYYIPNLVLSAFDPEFDGVHFYHKDFDTTNNHLSNLVSGFRDLGDDWKPVDGTDDLIWVSKYGEVYSRAYTYLQPSKGVECTLPERFIKQQHNYEGYLYVAISRFPKLCFVHRIVANAFIPNPDNKETVNHIDGNKENNCVSNLEWSTMKEQIDHAFSIGLRSYQTEIDKCRQMTEKNCMPVVRVDTGEIFPSIKAAAMSVGVTAEGLRDRLHKHKPLKKLGIMFMWLKDYESSQCS